jgi:putative phosphoesterase
MRIGLLSDIHCNLAGLETALDLLADCDELLCAGDLMYQYRFSTDILDMLDEHRVRRIVGNHDLSILYTPGHPIRENLRQHPEALQRLADVPRTLEVELGGLRLAMFHGSPWDEHERCYYIYPQDRDKLKRLAAVDADVVILGHTHIPFSLMQDDRLIVNPGSVGECRDGTGTLSCSVLDTATREIELRRFNPSPARAGA